MDQEVGIGAVRRLSVGRHDLPEQGEFRHVLSGIQFGLTGCFARGRQIVQRDFDVVVVVERYIIVLHHLRQEVLATDQRRVQLNRELVQDVGEFCLPNGAIQIGEHETGQGIDKIVVVQVQTVAQQARAELKAHPANIDQVRGPRLHGTHGVGEGGQIGRTVKEDKEKPCQLVGVTQETVGGDRELEDRLGQALHSLIHSQDQRAQLGA